MTSLRIPDIFAVTGRTALVTGGSSGIGFMIAQGLVANGVKTYITGLESDPIDARVSELQSLAESSGGAINGFPSDLSDSDSIKAVAEYIATRETSLDMLISNAGVHITPPIRSSPTHNVEEFRQAGLSLSPEAWDKTFQVNVTANYRLTLELLPLLATAAEKGEGRGSVVITSSVAAQHNSTNGEQTAYASSKAATDHLVHLMAVKLARFGVRVNSINPATFPSLMSSNNATIEGQRLEKVPLKRAGDACDATGIVIFLSSKAGSYITGENILLDGGRSLVANGQS